MNYLCCIKLWSYNGVSIAGFGPYALDQGCAVYLGMKPCVELETSAEMKEQCCHLRSLKVMPDILRLCFDRISDHVFDIQTDNQKLNVQAQTLNKCGRKVSC